MTLILAATSRSKNAAEIEAVAATPARRGWFLGSDRPGDYQALHFPASGMRFIAIPTMVAQTGRTVNATTQSIRAKHAGIWQQGGAKPSETARFQRNHCDKRPLLTATAWCVTAAV